MRDRDGRDCARASIRKGGRRALITVIARERLRHQGWGRGRPVSPAVECEEVPRASWRTREGGWDASRIQATSGALQPDRSINRVRPRDRDAASLYALRTAFIRVCQPVPCARNHSSTSGSTRSEIARLGETGFRPLRTIPRTMCRGSASGWLRLALISRSFREFTRVQSVCDALEVDFALTFRCLSP